MKSQEYFSIESSTRLGAVFEIIVRKAAPLLEVLFLNLLDSVFPELSILSLQV